MTIDINNLYEVAEEDMEIGKEILQKHYHMCQDRERGLRLG